MAATGVLIACATLFVSFLGLYLTFFGEQPREETPRDIARYRVQVAVGTSLLLTMCAAGWAHRRGWFWAALFGLILVACVVLLQIDGAWPEAPAEVPPPRRPPARCDGSGSTPECPGG